MFPTSSRVHNLRFLEGLCITENNVCAADQATYKRRFLFWFCHFIYSHSSAKLSSQLMELLDVGNFPMRKPGMMSCIYASAAVNLIFVMCNLYVKVAVIRNPVIQWRNCRVLYWMLVSRVHLKLEWSWRVLVESFRSVLDILNQLLRPALKKQHTGASFEWSS